MSHALNDIWFVLIGVLFAGYCLLDGFDLGVGALHLFARGDRNRRTLLNAIGPFWDGNEVWLLTGGGALFAAFPEVYATAFSGLYLALMLVLVALIARAVSIEFRGQRAEARWRRTWDVGFSAGSALAALLLGVAIGNLARGLPLGADREFAGTFFTLLHPYALLTGLTALALFAMHGALYLCLKTEGELRTQARGWARNAGAVFVAGYLLTTAATLIWLRPMTEPFGRAPGWLALPLVTALAIVLLGLQWRRARYGRAFLASGATILGLLGTFGVGMYPNLIRSHPAPAHSLTIVNAASSPKTLGIMLVIALIGMPLVIAYTIVVYRVFRGKVRLDSTGY
jgi:cytochrome d ubiquinol oxidase subunit II